MTAARTIYGMLAEFRAADALTEAIRRTRAAGYTRLDAFSPFPIEEVNEALGLHHSRLPLLVLVGGLLGAAGGYFLQYYASVVDYPLNVGGRPEHSWPAFIPVTFELTILSAALFAVLGMLALNGLPRPHHPLFNVPQFDLATRDRFFLCVESTDPLFDAGRTHEFLSGLGPVSVAEVPF